MKFIVNKEFKDSPIGKIPKDWDVKKLGDIITYKKGKKPEEICEDYQVECLPYLSAEYLREGSSTIYVKPSKGDVIVNDGDILLLWDGSNAGEFFYGRRGVLSSTMVKIEQKKQFFNQKFLFYVLKFKEKGLKETTKGTGIPHVEKSVLNNMYIPLPPLSEQQKIAEILSTVDTAIEKVNEEISKIELLKKGLMHELLTKGIGHKEFKDSPIGKIPKDWEIKKLEEIAKIIMGQSPPSSTYNNVGEGLPFLQGKLEFGDVYPSPRIYCSDPIKIAEAGDILISVRAPVGDVNLAPYKLCIGRGLAAIRINTKKGNYKFYFYYLQKEKDSWEKMSKGSTFKAINKSDIENFVVPLPPLSEQQKIAEILSTVDEILDLKKKKREKLEKLKNGLMNLLLTGKIRIIE